MSVRVAFTSSRYEGKQDAIRGRAVPTRWPGIFRLANEAIDLEKLIGVIGPENRTVGSMRPCWGSKPSFLANESISLVIIDLPTNKLSC